MDESIRSLTADEQVVLALANALGTSCHQLERSRNLEDQGFDSFDALEAMVDIEFAFGFEISNQEADWLRRAPVQSWIDHVKSNSPKFKEIA